MQIIKMPNLSAIKHGFITGLNISFKVNDDPDLVNKNRIQIAKAVDQEIIMLNQDHTETIIEVTEKNKSHLLLGYKNIDYTMGDGLFTKLTNTAISMYSGDCAVVFLYAPDIKAIGILHSGWRGSLGKLNENMIEKFIANKADLSKLMVAIGPSISAKSYEIGKDFYKNFINHDPDSSNFFIDEKYYNNAGYIASKYKKYGINNIYINLQDTYSDENLFSYRYYQHFGKKNGRMIGFISM